MKNQPPFEIRENGKEFVFQESLAQTLYASTLYTLGYSSLAVAVSNLCGLRPLPLLSMLASLAWIAIMLTAIISGCRKNGIRQHFGNALAHFVRNRFARFQTDDAGGLNLVFGCRIGGMRHHFLVVKPEGIATVEWDAGQGNIPGKENDWHVAIWFDPRSVVFDGIRDIVTDLYVLDSCGGKSHQEKLGAGFIRFLGSNDVRLASPDANLIGREAVVMEALKPLGRIRVGECEYPAFPISQSIAKGRMVTIKEFRGTCVYVRLKEESGHA